MPIVLPTVQKELQALVDRRHPAYDECLPHWTFLRQTYDGGRQWFHENIFKGMKEGKEEYDERKKRAYRFNHTREVVHLVTKYIFKSDIIRNKDEAPDALKRFWATSTKLGLPVDMFMTRVCDLSSIYGRVWVGTDTTAADLGSVITRRDEIVGDARVYAYTLTPENVLDYAWGDDGKLNWIMYRVTHRNDDDVITSSGKVVPRYVIWTRDSYAILEEQLERNRRKIMIIDQGENRIGEVPVFPVDDRQSDDPYDVPALIGDIAYLDRAVANYLSNLDTVIQDQTFSQLIMPAQGLMPGDDAYNKLLQMGTKRMFIYDGDSPNAPAFISPDPKQATMILAVINKIIGEIYHSIGMAGERTKQDNAVGIDNSSGVAKAYDFERVNSLLTAKADVLERAEDELSRIICLWASESMPMEDGAAKDLIKYPDSFDVRSLYDEFEIAQQLSLLSAPDEIRQEQMKIVVDKMFPRISTDLRNSLQAAIKDWPAQSVDVAPSLMVSERSKGAIGSLRESRQGQVTAQTPASPKGSNPAVTNK